VTRIKQGTGDVPGRGEVEGHRLHDDLGFMTVDSLKNLALKVGDEVAVVVKAVNILLMKP
jgi:hypothetical protein